MYIAITNVTTIATTMNNNYTNNDYSLVWYVSSVCCIVVYVFA